MTSVRAVSSYPEVGKLYMDYLDQLHEEWEPIVKAWAQEAGE